MSMKKLVLPIALIALLAPVLAWSPTPDAVVAQQIVDAAYNRGNPVPTMLALPLKPVGNAFPAGSEVGLLFGEQTCLTNWRQQPGNFTQFGSRPTSVTLAGQGYQIDLAARAARNTFRNISARDALTQAQQRLPSGHLQVYMQMEGLTQEAQRGSYNVGINLGGENFARPYRIAFLDDWQRGPDGRFGGSMLYYFDLSKATTFDSRGKLTLVFQTEAPQDCTYTLTADLSKFN